MSHKPKDMYGSRASLHNPIANSDKAITTPPIDKAWVSLPHHKKVGSLIESGFNLTQAERILELAANEHNYALIAASIIAQAQATYGE